MLTWLWAIHTFFITRPLGLAFFVFVIYEAVVGSAARIPSVPTFSFVQNRNSSLYGGGNVIG